MKHYLYNNFGSSHHHQYANMKGQRGLIMCNEIRQTDGTHTGGAVQGLVARMFTIKLVFVI